MQKDIPYTHHKEDGVLMLIAENADFRTGN